MKAGSKDVAKMFFSTFLRVGHSLPQNSQPSSKFTTFLKIQNLPQNSQPSSKFTTFLKIEVILAFATFIHCVFYVLFNVFSL